MEVKFDTESISRLKKYFTQLPISMREKVVADAAKAGAQEMAKELRRRAPVNTGLTKQSIGVFKKKVTKDNALYGAGPYKRVKAGFDLTARSARAEGGRRKYRRRKRGETNYKKLRRYYVALWYEKGRGGKTGPQPARPWLKPAFDAGFQAAQAVVLDAIVEGVLHQSRAVAAQFGVTKAVKFRYKKNGR